jgi:hypothetical protein
MLLLYKVTITRLPINVNFTTWRAKGEDDRRRINLHSIELSNSLEHLYTVGSRQLKTSNFCLQFLDLDPESFDNARQLLR